MHVHFDFSWQQRHHGELVVDEEVAVLWLAAPCQRGPCHLRVCHWQGMPIGHPKVQFERDGKVS